MGYGYGYGLGGYYVGYRTYGLGYGHGLYYGKREAEAEPYYGVYSAHHAVAPVVSYAHAPVVSHAVHAVAPVVSSYAQVSPSASPLLLEATLVPGATLPTPLEPFMLPRGRLR